MGRYVYMIPKGHPRQRLHPRQNRPLLRVTRRRISWRRRRCRGVEGIEQRYVAAERGSGEGAGQAQVR